MPKEQKTPRTALLEHIGEERIIRDIRKRFGKKSPRVVAGIGDDAAVTRQRKDRLLITTTDSLVQGVHFRPSYSPPYLIGRKSVAVSLSDIAAMGGLPLFLLVSIAMPARTGLRFLNEVYRGIASVCREHGLILIGGNTSASQSDMVITTTVLGEVPAGELVRRKGARENDLIFVTGSLGDSGLGLEALRRGCPARTYARAIKRHLDPEPRVLAGRLLARNKIPTAMIDASDGLIADLGHMAEESNVRAKVFFGQVPLSEAFRKGLSKGLCAPGLAIAGGEDYELLFTAPVTKTGEIKRLSARLGLPITPIGKVERGKKGLLLIDDKGRALRPGRAGFEHFR